MILYEIFITRLANTFTKISILNREANMAKLLKGAIKKTRFEFPSCVSEGPTEFVFEKNVPVNDFLSYIVDTLMRLFFFPGKIEG